MLKPRLNNGPPATMTHPRRTPRRRALVVAGLLTALIIVAILAGAGSRFWRVWRATHTVAALPATVELEDPDAPADPVVVPTIPARRAEAQAQPQAKPAPRQAPDIAPPGAKDPPDLPGHGGRKTTPQAAAAREPAPPETQTSAPEVEPVAVSRSGGTNVMMLGVDARPGKSIDVGVRPDSISVIHLEGSTCRQLSIPRDTRVYLPYVGSTKINHALPVGGIAFQRQVVEAFLGIKIDNYVLFDLSGLSALVDAVGGLDVSPPYRFHYAGVDFNPGTQHLNGFETKVYVIYRSGPDGDFGRVRRQQEVLSRLAGYAANLTQVNTALAYLSMLEGHVRTDLSLNGVMTVFGAYRGACGSGRLQAKVVDGTPLRAWDPLLRRQLSFLSADPALVRERARWLRTP